MLQATTPQGVKETEVTTRLLLGNAVNASRLNLQPPHRVMLCYVLLCCGMHIVSRVLASWCVSLCMFCRAWNGAKQVMGSVFGAHWRTFVTSACRVTAHAADQIFTRQLGQLFSRYRATDTAPQWEEAMTSRWRLSIRSTATLRSASRTCERTSVRIQRACA